MTVVHALLIIWTLLCIVPIIMVISVSFTDELTFASYGFSFIPKQFSIEAWRTIVSGGAGLLLAAAITIVTAIIQPLLSQALAMMVAYPLCRPDFVIKKWVIWFFMVPMFVSGGMIAAYILRTKWLGLMNSLLNYIIPSIGLWNIVLYRTCFKQVPSSLIEAATIDGASEWKILWHVMLPMSRSIFVIQFFTAAIGCWNDYFTSMLYFTEPRYYKIQYVIFKMLQDSAAIKQALQITGLDNEVSPPDKTLNYAMCVVAFLPVICVFPLIQKYFAKGIAAGSIKE